MSDPLPSRDPRAPSPATVSLGDEPATVPNPHLPGAAEPYVQEDWLEEYDELPPRPRRRLLTPVNLGLLGALLVAAGFIGGVLVEKGQSNTTTTAGGGARRALAAAAAGGGAGRGGFAAALGGGAGAAGGASATVGTVSTVDGHTLYVTDTEGNTIKVDVGSGATVTKTSRTATSAIHPGDTVIVAGPKASDGGVTATSVRATASNAGTGGGFASLFGGASSSAAGGRGSAGSGSGGTGGGSSGGPSLFGSG